MMKFEPGIEGKKEARKLFGKVNDLYNVLRDLGMLTGSLEAGLRELRDQLTDILCPYPVEELDRHVKALDEKFPDWEHWYIRCGTTVTWCDRPIKEALQ
jgi:hypothetical protein